MKISYSKNEDFFGIDIEAENDGDRAFLRILEARHDENHLTIEFSPHGREDQSGESPQRLSIDALPGGEL